MTRKRKNQKIVQIKNHEPVLIGDKRPKFQNINKQIQDDHSTEKNVSNTEANIPSNKIKIKLLELNVKSSSKNNINKQKK